MQTMAIIPERSLSPFTVSSSPMLTHTDTSGPAFLPHSSAFLRQGVFCNLALNKNHFEWCFGNLPLLSRSSTLSLWLADYHANVCTCPNEITHSRADEHQLGQFKKRSPYDPYRSSCGSIFSFLSNKYLGVELLGHTQGVFTSKRNSRSTKLPTSNSGGFPSPLYLPILGIMNLSN